MCLVRFLAARAISARVWATDSICSVKLSGLVEGVTTGGVDRGKERDVVTDTAIDEYGAAIGSVMEARRRYEVACRTYGEGSLAAQQAAEFLAREIKHRDEMRVRHDAAPDHRRGE